METPDKTIKYNLFDYAYYVGRSFILPWLDGNAVVIYPLMMVIALLLPSFCDGVLGISGDTIPLIIFVLLTAFFYILVSKLYKRNYRSILVKAHFNETKWAKWYMKLLFSIFWLLLPFLIIGLIFVLSGGLE